MTYDEIQAIVNKMNAGTATPEEEKEVKEWAEIKRGWDACEEKWQLIIISTVSYGFL